MARFGTGWGWMGPTRDRSAHRGGSASASAALVPAAVITQVQATVRRRRYDHYMREAS